MPQKAATSAAALTLMIGLLAGCHSNSKSTNRYDTAGGNGSIAVVPNDSVILDLPTVRVDKENVYITGTVHRHPSVSGEIAGRVDIEFLGPEGEYLDGLPALLSPRNVPTDPSSSATYVTSYGYIPPAGSTIRVHFIDRDTQIEEDLSGNSYGYGTGTGAHGGAGGPKTTGSNSAHNSGGGGHGTHW